MSKARILFVDDEPNVLAAIRRSLRDEYEVHTAESGADALLLIEASEPFAVICSDCRMPKMDGIELLARCAEASPLSVRLMLTGNMDQETAVKAVNTGDVFKFLNKPCEVDALKHVIGQAVRQFELVTAEKVLLEQTLKGSIKALADVLSIAKPEAFGRTDRIRRKVRDVAKHADGTRNWELDAAALLSQLGCINISQEILDKLQRGDTLSNDEAADFAAHPLLGADLIGRIPRLGRVAKIILYQNKNYDGTGFPADDVKAESIPLESRILHAVLLHDHLHQQGWSDPAIMEKLSKTAGHVDPGVLAALAKASDLSEVPNTIRLLPSELLLGMIVQEDIKTDAGMMLLCHGQEVTPAIREHLVKFETQGTLTKRILVARERTAPAETKAAEKSPRTANAARAVR